MAESFFGFGAGIASQPLGKDGKDTVLKDGSLIPGADDEDIDLLNDETFGDGGVWDYDQTHTELGDSLYEENEKTRDSAYNTAEKQGRDDEEFTEMPHMEQSLSQLVVDDDEINDPAIVNMSKSRPIPKPVFDREQNLDDLFGPSSPPGLLDTDDLVSPSHKNIWRPPEKDQFTFNTGQAYKDPSVITAGQPIQRNMPPQKFDQTPTQNRALTVEELERQMRDQTVPQRHMSPPLPGMPVPIGTPPQRHFVHPNQVGPWMSTPGPQPSRTCISPPQVVPQQFQVQTPTMINHHPRGVMSESPYITAGMRQTPSPTMQGPPIMDNCGMPLNLSPAMIAKLYPHLLRTPVGQIRGALRMNTPHTAQGRISPTMNQSFMAHSPMGQRIPQRMPYTDPTHMRQHNRDYWQEEQHDRSYYNHRGGYHRGYRGRGNYHYQHSYNHEPQEPEDEYANLMTQREKDWIIKIQMLQLSTDNPYIDDYYYTQYKIKQMAMERRRQRNSIQGGEDSKEPKLLLPQLAKIETKEYSPAQFVGSLGKLTASSVHNPRQIIDAKVTASDTEVKGGKYRQLLLYMEKMYDVLLDVEDIEKRVLVLPTEGREALFAERYMKINQMFANLHCDSNAPEQFVMYMSIRKGKKLVNRMMPLLNKDQLVSIVLATLKNLPILIKKDVLDEVLPDLYDNVSQVIKSSSMQDLVMFGLALQNAAVPTSQTNPLMSALQNKFGVSVVCSMMSRAETIYIESPLDVDNSQQDQWSEFVIAVGETLSVANERTLSLPKPLEKFNNLIPHFERVLSRKVLAGLEDRLRAWTQG